MTLWLLVPLLLLIAVVQVTLMPPLPIGGFKIDLQLMLVVAWGLLGPAWEAARWGFIVGIFLDLASGLPFGAQTLALTIVGLLMGLGQMYFFRGNVVAPPAAMIVGTLVYNVLILGILALIGWQIPWNDYLLRVTLPMAILNTIALPLAYFPLQRLQRRLRPQIEW